MSIYYQYFDIFFINFSSLNFYFNPLGVQTDSDFNPHGEVINTVEDKKTK